MALTNAERQARYRERRQAGEARIRYRRPADRRSRPQQWDDAVRTLLALQDQYRARQHTLRHPSPGPRPRRCSSRSASSICRSWRQSSFPGGSGVTAEPPATSFRLVATTRRCRAHQHDRVLAGVKARRFAPPPLRGADGLDAGCAHGPRRSCPTAQGTLRQEGQKSDVLTENWGGPFTDEGGPPGPTASKVPKGEAQALPRQPGGPR